MTHIATPYCNYNIIHRRVCEYSLGTLYTCLQRRTLGEVLGFNVKLLETTMDLIIII